MVTKWLIWVLCIGALYLFNTVYTFFPESLLKRFPYLKIIALLVALAIFGLFVKEQFESYKNISYAKVSSNGQILETKNFKYSIQKTTAPEGGVLYIINDFYSAPLLEVNVKKGVDVQLSNRIIGVGIQFRVAGKVVEPDFTVQIIKP